MLNQFGGETLYIIFPFEEIPIIFLSHVFPLLASYVQLKYMSLTELCITGWIIDMVQ